MASDKKLSQREFAERAGVSPTTVRNRIADGTIKPDREGKIALSAGLAALSRRKREVEEGREIDPATVDLEQQLLEARTKERQAIAKLRALELDHKEGKFVELEGVQRDARNAAETIRAALLSLPSRVALQVEALAAQNPRAPEIEALILDEINAVLVALQGSRYAA